VDKLRCFDQYCFQTDRLAGTRPFGSLVPGGIFQGMIKEFSEWMSGCLAFWLMLTSTPSKTFRFVRNDTVVMEKRIRKSRSQRIHQDGTNDKVVVVVICNVKISSNSAGKYLGVVRSHC
jgi:hypothetical protein